MDCPVVCIARTLGSKGEEVARLVAEKAGFRYVDEEVVLHAAELGSVDVELVQNAEKRKSFVEKLIEGFSGAGSYHATEVMAFGTGAYVYSPAHRNQANAETEEDLRKLIRDAIHDIAKQGSAVIVAHAASFALKDDDSALRVFVTASRNTRAERLQSGEIDQRAAEAKIKESDSARAQYLSRFYGENDEGPRHYDLCINTDRMTPEQAADLILSLVQVRETTPA